MGFSEVQWTLELPGQEKKENIILVSRKHVFELVHCHVDGGKLRPPLQRSHSNGYRKHDIYNALNLISFLSNLHY